MKIISICENCGEKVNSEEFYENGFLVEKHYECRKCGFRRDWVYGHITQDDSEFAEEGEWYRWEDNIKPQDKQLCLVIPKGENYVGIYQYRAPEKRWPQFLDVSHAFVYSNMDTDFRLKHYLDYISPSYVDRWKFLNLPEDVNERILEEIEKWFDN